MNDLLSEGLQQLLDKSPLVFDLLKERKSDVCSSLNAYISEIEMYNPRYGLIKYEKRDDLVIKHILDSLAALDPILKIIKETFSFADLGSGAGLPGIPLAIALKNHSWTLIERSGKRADFLQNSKAILGLDNVEVLQSDFSTVQKKFDFVTFRALSSLDSVFVKNIFRLLHTDGCIAAYKGRIEKIEDEIANLDYKKDTIVKIERIDVPFLDESRHLITFST